MSKSKQTINRATQALRRRARSLLKKVLDNERDFIDDLMTLQNELLHNLFRGWDSDPFALIRDLPRNK